MKKREVFSVYLGTLFIALSYGCLVSLPLFVNKLGGNAVITGVLLSTAGVGTIGAVLFSKYLFRIITPNVVAAIGSFIFALCGLAFFTIHQINYFMYLVMFCSGIGWGFYYNSAPYALSLCTSSPHRSMFFSYQSGFSVMGSSVTPIIITLLWPHEINFSYLFIGLSLLALISSYLFQRGRPHFRKIIPKAKISSVKQSSFNLAFSSLIRYPLLMILLNACIFTMVTNFQTIFAKSAHLNYAYFFIFYSISIVSSRMILGKYIARFDLHKVLLMMLCGLILAMLSFVLAPYGTYFYILTAIIFGISYSLIYPILQGILANLTPINHRADIMTYFSLAYFTGLYAFPPLGGKIIISHGYSDLFIILAIIAAMQLVLGIILFKKQAKNVEHVLEPIKNSSN